MNIKIIIRSFIFTPFLLLTTFNSQKVDAGVPVIDVANLTETIISVGEQIAQTLKQIEEYSLQTWQWQDQIQNTLAPAVFYWDEVNRVMDDIRNANDSLRNSIRQVGDINAYLDNFKDGDWYRASPCYSKTGCSDTDADRLADLRFFRAASEKEMYDGAIKQILQDQDQLDQDARDLERLQRNTESADGRMKALQAANQLASNQSTQLMKLRAALQLMNQMVATYHQSQRADKDEAQAAEILLQEGDFVTSPQKTWKLNAPPGPP